MAVHNIPAGKTFLWTPVVRFDAVPVSPELGYQLKPPGRGYFVEVSAHAGTMGTTGTVTIDVEINNTTIFSTNPTVSTAGTVGKGSIYDGKINTSANTFDGNDVIRIEAVRNLTGDSTEDVDVQIVAIINGPSEG